MKLLGFYLQKEEVHEMKKTLFFLGLVSVLSVALVASSSYAAGMNRRGGFTMFNSSDLIGAPVKDSNGKLMAVVQELLVDPDGHAFVVVNHGDYDLYGDGGVNTPIPFEALRISETKAGQDTVVLKTDMEHLDFAPYLNPIGKETRQDEANIYEYYGIQPYWTRGGASGKMGKDEYTAYEVSSLIGSEVDNPMGVAVGSIHDFAVDSKGRVDFVILTYNFPSEYAPEPPRTVAIPFSAITLKPDTKVAVLKFSGWKLELAPQFAKSDMNNRKWARDDYRYFGLQPPWTERRTTVDMKSYMWRGW